MSLTPASGKDHFDTSIVRGIAALLIINSHSEALYPYGWMADGGQLGISIFFIVAGMGTVLSKQSRDARFPSWYGSRLARIYPSIWIVVGVSLLLGIDRAQPSSASNYFRQLIYPISGYTFFAQVIPFYAVGFAVVRWSTNRQLRILVGVVGLLCIVAAVPDAVSLYPRGQLELGRLSSQFWWCCYFELYLLGMLYAADSTSLMVQRAATKRWLLVATIAYVALKYLMVLRGEIAYAFILLWAVVAMWSFCVIAWLSDAGVRTRVVATPLVGRWLPLLGGLSLETFLVHEQLLRTGLIRPLVFPANILALILLTVGIAWPLSTLSTFVRVHLQPAHKPTL